MGARLAAARRGGGPTLHPACQAEVARLRDEVDQLTAQVMRLTDEQRFLMRLLAEGRPAPDATLLPPQPENP